MIIWFWTWKTWFAVCSLNITWMRSVGRFLSGVRSPDEVFKRSKAMVAISEVQRLIGGEFSADTKCSKSLKITQRNVLWGWSNIAVNCIPILSKYQEHACPHFFLEPPRRSCGCRSPCPPLKRVLRNIKLGKESSEKHKAPINMAIGLFS